MATTRPPEQAFHELAASRRSVRDFLPTPVPDDIVHAILQDAVLAPSWSNVRPYRFAVATLEVRDRISLALLSRADDLLQLGSSKLWARLKGAVFAPKLLLSDFRVPVVYPKDLRGRQRQLGKALFGHMGIARSDRVGRDDFVRRNMEFFGAPVVIFVFARSRMGVYSALDAGHAMQNLMLSAKAHGLGSCPQGFLAFWSKPIRKEFAIPRGYKLLCGISLGYPSPAALNDFVPPATTPDDVVVSPIS